MTIDSPLATTITTTASMPLFSYSLPARTRASATATAKLETVARIRLPQKVHFWEERVCGDAAAQLPKTSLIPLVDKDCFANMMWNSSVRSIRFLAVLDWQSPAFSNEEALFWVRFLRTWLTHLRWSATLLDQVRMGSSGASHRCVLFQLHNDGQATRIQALLYLTAFRYLHKSAVAEAVRTLYRLHTGPDQIPLSSLFEHFQEWHVKHGPPSTETLFLKAPYGGSAGAPVSLDRFHARFTGRGGEKAYSVQSHFA